LPAEIGESLDVRLADFTRFEVLDEYGSGKEPPTAFTEKPAFPREDRPCRMAPPWCSGRTPALPVTKPKALGQFVFWSEEVYLPDADLILLMNLFSRPDGKLGNAVWDPNDSKFYWVDLRFVEADKPAEFKGNPFSWSDALAYDPELKLVLLNNSSAGKVWAMKFDRKTAKMEPME
jgi:hypothetical protein